MHDDGGVGCPEASLSQVLETTKHLVWLNGNSITGNNANVDDNLNNLLLLVIWMMMKII